MSILNWFGKKKEELYVEEVPNFNMVPDNYTKEEVDSLIAELKLANEKLMTIVDNQTTLITLTRNEIEIIKNSIKPDFVTAEQLNFVIESMSTVLRDEIEDALNTRTAVVDPNPAPSSPPAGWMYAIQDEIFSKTEMAKAEVKSYVDDCLNAYDAGEDLEIEERLANLSPLTAEEIDALYMDEAETTSVAQKTLNGFRAELYNKAVNDLKLIPTTKATVAAVRAFLVKFVESMKPV